MIKSFRHKGLEIFFRYGNSKGIKSDHIKKLRQILGALNAATELADIQSMKPFRCHALSGNRNKEQALGINKNWRVTFIFENGDAYLINYEDYHDGKIRR
ncbi:MAG: type II toxin-antitoxin system RelE/ParE family toxin [Legionellales bacterium]|nr:type II toxin-antitoxin system RelE/ParE family toxin [Legionellales bacterium]